MYKEANVNKHFGLTLKIRYKTTLRQNGTYHTENRLNHKYYFIANSEKVSEKNYSFPSRKMELTVFFFPTRSMLLLELNYN